MKSAKIEDNAIESNITDNSSELATVSKESRKYD
jgi:hypothetical protein